MLLNCLESVPVLVVEERGNLVGKGKKEEGWKKKILAHRPNYSENVT